MPPTFIILTKINPYFRMIKLTVSPSNLVSFLHPLDVSGPQIAYVFRDIYLVSRHVLQQQFF